MYPDVLSKCIESVFGCIQPNYVLITTPNREFNVVFEQMNDGANDACHDDHHHEPSSCGGNPTKPRHDVGHQDELIEAMEKKPQHGFRHWDHKFEWTRREFESWCQSEVLDKYPLYALMEPFSGLGQPPVSFSSVGYCTQMALFVRKDLATAQTLESNRITSSENKLEAYIKVRVVFFLSFFCCYKIIPKN